VDILWTVFGYLLCTRHDHTYGCKQFKVKLHNKERRDMSSKLRNLRHSLVLLGLLLALVAAAPLQAGGDPQGKGKYGNLTAQWWQWVYAQPTVDQDGTNTNPLLDSTGAYAAAGQEYGSGPAGKYFFLAGTVGANAERTVTVPADKGLFFPVINFEADNAVPANEDGSLVHKSVPELRAMAAEFVDATTSKYARLDGQDLEILRVESPTFAYTLPAQDSLYAYYTAQGWCACDEPQYQGTIKPVVSDGYWVYVPPLPRGKHTLEFGGSSTDFSIDIVYHLTVE